MVVFEEVLNIGWKRGCLVKSYDVELEELEFIEIRLWKRVKVVGNVEE